MTMILLENGLGSQYCRKNGIVKRPKVPLIVIPNSRAQIAASIHMINAITIISFGITLYIFIVIFYNSEISQLYDSLNYPIDTI